MSIASQRPATAPTSVPADCGERRTWRTWLGTWKEPLVTRALWPVRTCLGPRCWPAFGMLMYHRVCEAPRGVPRPTWNVTPDRFRRQLAGLLKRGYRPWPLRRVLERAATGESIPRNVFVVTFDDGYENNFTRAFPVLRELRVPATIFLSTAYLGEDAPFPSDDWTMAGSADVPADSWRPLSFSQCEQLHASSLIELGAHTHTHADFRGRPEEFEADLAENVRVLRERFGIERPSFAFPYGTKSLGFAGGELAEVARRSDVRCALTTEDALVDPRRDPYDWGRFTAHQYDTPATLATKLDGWYAWARRLIRGNGAPTESRGDETRVATEAVP